MTRKQVQKLAELSYTENQLDVEKVEAVVKKVNREDLKEYIREIKHIEQGHSVVVTLPYVADSDTQKKFTTLFPNKKIVYNLDLKILPGVRVQMNDLLFEMSLQERIEKLLTHIQENYE